MHRGQRTRRIDGDRARRGRDRSVDATWFLRNSNSDGGADVSFVYGDPGDIAMVGDRNDDGIDTPAVGRYHVDANGLAHPSWYIRNENTTGVADERFEPCFFDQPLPGAWLGGTADVCGSFQPAYAQWIFGGATPDDPRPPFLYGNPYDVALRWN